MPRTLYINDDATSNIDKIKQITFEGTSPEEYVSTLVQLQTMNTNLRLTDPHPNDRFLIVIEYLAYFTFVTIYHTVVIVTKTVITIPTMIVV